MRTIRYLLVLLALLVSGCSGDLGYTNIDNEQLHQLLTTGTPLYDIRRLEEWRETGVVKGSRRLTFFDAKGGVNPKFLPEFTRRIGKDDPVVLICRTGNRTSALAKYLVQELGYTKVYNVARGITGWISQGRDVSRR